MLRAVQLLLALLALTAIGCGDSGSNGDKGDAGGEIPTPSPVLPPDPGKAGKATLEGIDSNHNGVRDDVEIAIWKYAPNQNQEIEREAMFQYAKAVQRILIVVPSGDITKILEVERESAYLRNLELQQVMARKRKVIL
ncbi:hypothetical protein AGMMS50229_18250 [Campylobacterota bacterium]|nr:hypothetical protein AGMMS50229_18250 [Campylobacterota bacterium]